MRVISSVLISNTLLIHRGIRDGNDLVITSSDEQTVCQMAVFAIKYWPTKIAVQNSLNAPLNTSFWDPAVQKGNQHITITLIFSLIMKGPSGAECHCPSVRTAQRPDNVNFHTNWAVGSLWGRWLGLIKCQSSGRVAIPRPLYSAWLI